ncbi:hypothetical protein BBBOND_0306920 [Babesia bigemina]|uniref:Uncharacterized protein n=1 Tax=Babesia bigemina TaxID=5866 RepID=A0A061D8F9_BABBI|nr:hypothetical protein BBBOND_0306920 [Babesia bigemina]CDR96788.1 hypothetical protein BBBOND_0306920 [Babesia bigemina]|eukprot:XP_012768974.1 hypothetical protein BBBOND_0306920 [Babesia bigemina]
MASIHDCMWRRFAYLLYLYTVIINASAVGAVGGAGDPDVAGKGEKTLAFYANDPECRTRLKSYTTLIAGVDDMKRYLAVLTSVIPKSDSSPEAKEAELRECKNLLKTIQTVIHKDKYDQLANLFAQYDSIKTALQNKGVTRERSAELNKELADLEIQFKNLETYAAALVNINFEVDHKQIIERTQALIEKHRGPKSPQIRRGGKAVLNANTPLPRTMNQQQRKTDEKPSNEMDAQHEEEITTDHIHGMKNTKDSSGHAALGIMVINTMVAIGLMAAF